MNNSHIKKLAEAWISHAKVIIEEKDTDTFVWAWDEEFDLKYENPKLLWELIQEIHAKDKNGSVTKVLSAGPLEDLLSMHGQDFIDLIEIKAKQDPSFAFLLGGVWRSSINEKVWERVQKSWDRKGWDGILKES
jgi:hypothetical protein